MKSKSLIFGAALAGVVAMSAANAQAGAFMELISGSSSILVNNSPVGTVGGNFQGVTGNGAIFIGTVGTWSVDIASGGESGPFNVTLTDNINGGAPATSGLEVIYSSGPYALSGPYNFGASDAGGNNLTATVSGYYNNSSMFTGSSLTDLANYEAASTLMGSWVLPTVLAASHQNLNLPINGSTEYITEVIELGGTTGSIAATTPTINVTASFTPTVPDGGTTATMIGSALLGLVAFRSKFGAKA